MYKYLIYDFDGTISDSYPVYTKAFLELAERYHVETDYDTAYALLKQSTGAALKAYDFGVPYEQLRVEYDDLYCSMVLENSKPLPGASEILKFGKEQGKINYIYTHSGEWVFHLLEDMGNKDDVEYVLGAFHHFPRKPAPDALYFLFEKFGIDKSQALMIGDRDIDIQVAHAAGIAGCMYDPEGFYKDVKCEYYIKDLCELKDII